MLFSIVPCTVLGFFMVPAKPAQSVGLGPLSLSTGALCAQNDLGFLLHEPVTIAVILTDPGVFCHSRRDSDIACTRKCRGLDGPHSRFGLTRLLALSPPGRH